MSRKLGISSYEGDVTEEATEPLLVELAQDSRGMGWVRHLCWGGHGASLRAQPTWSRMGVAQQVPSARPLPSVKKQTMSSVRDLEHKGPQELGGGSALRVKEDMGCFADPDRPRSLCQIIRLAISNWT